MLRITKCGLTLLVGEHGIGREIRWAHVSELDDPTPWLEGGEFLLTTGLNATWDFSGAREYCQRLNQAGVVALGVSTGASLPHEVIPDGLVRGAKAADLALVHIQEDVPLQTIVRAVADAINVELNQPLRTTVEIQRQLSEAAATGGGIQGVLDRLGSAANLRCAVYDARLATLASNSGVAESMSPELRREIRKRLLGSVRSSMSLQEGESTLIALPLGTDGSMRGVFTARHSGQLTTYERSLIKMAVPILSLLLDVAYAGGAHARRARAAVLDALLDGQESLTTANAILKEASVAASSVQVVRAQITSGAQLRGFIAGLAELAEDVLFRREDDLVIAMLCNPVEDAMDSLQELITDVRCISAGLGRVVEPHEANLSLQQATRVQTIAQSRGVPLVALPDYDSRTALMLLGNPSEQDAFSDVVLQALDAHDRINVRQPLLPALRAFFDSTGSTELAASQLGIHRHTMRSRLTKIGEISERDLSNASDYLDLWLAVEFRRMRAGRRS